MAVINNITTGVKKSFGGLISFLSGSFHELKKVRWPSRREMFNYTLVVLSTIIIFSLFFFVVDFCIFKLVKFVIEWTFLFL